MKNSSARSAESAEIVRTVRDFYDRYPYPPPVDDLDAYRRRWEDRQRRRADAHLFWPEEPFREDRSLLVAGCGTAQAAKYALRWPGARVVGIDVSPTSLRRTDELRRRHRLENLEVRELPVERAAELGERFDQVVCTGVIHHLPDPDTGLRALREVLTPGGTLHLMVYAPYGRAGVYLLQKYCRLLGIGTSAPEIRDLAASLRALPPDHPLVPLLRAAPDFRQEAGLADALLNPRDRPYSVPELFDFLRRCGLRFARWVRQAPYLPRCGALAASPHRSLKERLPAEQQYAAVELFRGTMARHSVVAVRDDRPGRAQPISFDDNSWPAYVPLRMPDTICVQEKLPPGAAGVLINRSHTFTDLYLPIDAREKSLFDAIDGEHTIGEIAAQQGDRDTTRRLFERLWWYDQVVFDASRAAGALPRGKGNGTWL